MSVENIAPIDGTPPVSALVLPVVTVPPAAAVVAPAVAAGVVALDGLAGVVGEVAAPVLEPPPNKDDSALPITPAAPADVAGVVAGAV